ncbi:leucine-rich repeat domain-containing protein [Paenibacillus barcinonensis]|uniref:Leucine rich repeat (LRR) protein n=1 Tax=Paenibacillus barcinonensis TaxID=198119 RepID=A0A2V4V9Y1_PAEBA|nr:leucine-rich repeat domain-containing protein [Paenibacillus barcinonensis]PYE48881.1 leucine rich repeat (LRR) protein [Paenibacillus barcinonensis]QKS57704.1 leucine-rich repeat domain-containing protein [Paenibacillus barcinonensis]
MRRFTLLLLICILSISSAGQALAYTVSDTEQHLVKDPALEDGLKLILNIPVGEPLTSADLRQLRVVDLSNSGIRSLSGLEHAVNLTHLRLYGNEITSLAPLEHLTQLREIDIRNNYITSIQPLEALQQLGRLYISNNSISSIDVVRSFPRLHTLHASGNKIASLDALTGLRSLQWLEISNNVITDLTPLAAQTRLKQLNLANNHISSLDVFTDMPDSLRELNVSNNHISSLKPLSHMLHLRTLDISGNQIQHLNDIAALTGLTELNAESNQIYDLEPLRSFTSLSVLKLSNNRIWDLTPISDLSFTQESAEPQSIDNISASTSMSSLAQQATVWPESAGLTVQHNYLDVSSGSYTMSLLNQMNVREQKRTPQGHFQRLIEGSTTAYVGDRAYSLDTAPFISEGRTYVPLRFVSEQLNARVNWNNSTREATITHEDEIIRWSVGSKQVTVGDELVMNDAPLLMKDGHTYVPVRFISEQLHTTVGYIARSKTILIFENKPQPEDMIPQTTP